MHHFQLSPSLDLVHNMAQYVHCLAQGKVGSGFDICSAVKGSQIYTRFDERVLRALMSKDEVTGQEVRRIGGVLEHPSADAFGAVQRSWKLSSRPQNGQHVRLRSRSRQISVWSSPMSMREVILPVL